jgi:hypothetical protein
MTVLTRVAPPNLPVSPPQYSAAYQNQYSNVLRLYFNALSSTLNAPISYASFFDTTTQTTPANTPKALTYNTIDIASGIITGTPNSRVRFEYAGIYNLQFSLQMENSDVADQDVNIWFRINGINVSTSTGLVSVPAKHGGVNGHTIVGWNYVLRIGAGQYVELIWCPGHAGITIPYIAAAVGPPAIPAAASVILTVTTIAIL